jgi:hypothetical protein
MSETSIIDPYLFLFLFREKNMKNSNPHEREIAILNLLLRGSKFRWEILLHFRDSNYDPKTISQDLIHLVEQGFIVSFMENDLIKFRIL